MYSARYHLAYWGISAATAGTYRVASYLCADVILHSLLAASTVYALHSLRNGPGHPQTHPRLYFASAGCLLVSLGSLTKYFRAPDLDITPIRSLIHILLAFTALGVLEPLRRNRRDIEPVIITQSFLMPTVEMFPEPEDGSKRSYKKISTYFWPYALSINMVALAGIVLIVDLGLEYVYGPGVTCQSISASQLREMENGYLTSALFLPHLIVPLADISDTIFCLVHKRLCPKQVKAPGPLVCPGKQWDPTELNIFRTWFWWVCKFLTAWLGVSPKNRVVPILSI